MRFFDFFFLSPDFFGFFSDFLAGVFFAGGMAECWFGGARPEGARSCVGVPQKSPAAAGAARHARPPTGPVSPGAPRRTGTFAAFGPTNLSSDGSAPALWAGPLVLAGTTH